MRRLDIVVLMLVLVSAARGAESTSLPAKLHPWGQFDLGARKIVQVKTETLDEQGHVVGTSITDTATILRAVDKDGVTLEIDACVEVVGKQFEAEPQTIKQGFHGELLSPDATYSEPADVEVVVDDRKIPCKQQQIESSGPTGRTVTRLYYSTTVAPYVFRRESVATDAEGKLVSETTMEVTSLEMPWIVLPGESKSVFDVRTVHRSAKGTVTTLAKISPEIPGGVVSHSSKEVDKNGRIVRRSTLELIDYSTEPEPERPFRSKRAARHNRSKNTTRYGP